MKLSTLYVALVAKVATAICVESEQIDGCIELETDVPIINTLDEARIMNKVYKGQVRVENLNGTYAMIDHANSRHIGSVEGVARDYLSNRLDAVQTRGAQACAHNPCAIVISCPGCAFCYPTFCF